LFWLCRANEPIVPFGTTAPALEPAPLRKTYLQAVAGLRGKRIVLVPGRVSAKNGCDLLSRKRSALRMCSR
jgi:hypothetical protein